MNPQTIMNRRHFIHTLSGTALTFPWFSNLALHGAEASKAPRRLVCIGLDFGLRPESFFPTTHGPELALTPLLKPLGPNNGVRPYPAGGVTRIASFRRI
jgi:hypothetical protein